MEAFAMPLVLAVVLAFLAFRQWLRHQERAMAHRERLAAIEKGVELPPRPASSPHTGLGVRGVLLLSGLVWMALGLGGMVAGYLIVPQVQSPEPVPPSLWVAGLVPLLVGVAHLAVYRASARPPA
jgi:hypothetical protein